MHRICKLVIFITPFALPSFAAAQQSSVTTETVSTPDSNGIARVEGIPRVVRFTGTLAHVQPGTNISVLFSLYEEQEGQTALWQEAQNVQPDSQGRFTVLLGSTRKDGLPLDVFVNGKAHWLGMQVQPGQGQEAPSQQPSDQEQRVLLVGVPYALKAADADTLGGLPASAYIHTKADPKTGKSLPGKDTNENANSSDNPATNSAAALSGTGSTNYIPKWLSSSSLGNSLLYQTSTSIGFGTTSPISKFEVVGTSPATMLEGYNSATSGSTIGVNGAVNSTTGTGVYGKASATSGATVGVRGTALSTTGTGVVGSDTATSGATAGVVGQVSSKTGVGGVFNNTAGGKILSGRNNGTEEFSVDGGGNLTALGTVNASGIPAIMAYSDGGDTIVAHTFDSSAIHAYGGQSYSTAAISADGGQVPGLIATASDGCEFGPPCVVLSSQSSSSSANCVMDSSGNLTCTGTKSAAVDTASGRKLALYAVESPENWFEDFGSAKLSSGVGSVKLDPVFAQTVNSAMDYHIFLTPNEDCKGLYVSRKTPTSFEVHELGGGVSNVSFDYRIVARRKGYESVRLADVTEKMKKRVPMARPTRTIAAVR